MKTDLVVLGYIINENMVLLIHHKKYDLWLPVGGHIEKDETPDDALHREIREEVNLKVEILNRSNLPEVGNTKENLATPFNVNTHSVGDHDHCGLAYICKAINADDLQINSELIDCGWFTKEDLEKDHVPPDVRSQALRALELYEELDS